MTDTHKTNAQLAIENQQLRNELEQKHIELKHCNQRYYELYNHSQDVLFILDPVKGEIVEVNNGVKAMLGYSPDELKGRPMTDLHRDEVPELMAFFSDVLQKGEGQTDTLTCLTKSGEKRFADISAFLIEEDGKKLAVAAIRDITERKQADKKLRKSEARFSGILELAHDAIISIDQEQKIIIFNQSAEKMFGYSQDEILGESIDMLVPERFQESHHKLAANSINENDMKSRGAMIGLRKNGEEFPIETSFSVFESEEQKIITATIHDITEKKLADEALHKLSSAMEQAGEGVMITDRNAIIEYVNPAFSKITGYSSEEVVGKDPSILKSSAQDASHYKELWDTITQGEVWHGTLTDRRKDGSFYPALMSIAPIHNDRDEITHFISTQQDITEFKKMEEQFLQAQKMEAIGTLVGGIAHDFNNVLGAMKSNVYLAKRNLENVTDVSDRLDNIEKLGMRAADMIKQLLTFARKDKVSVKPFSLNSFMKEGFKLAKSAIPENIEHVCNICQEELIIQGDVTQLQQALMNLLNNACHAVSGVVKPNITCSLSHYVANDEFVQAHPDLSGTHFAHLTVRDNGCGITNEHLNKVFEPFFTTKGAGEGTGLGLAMVYGSIQTHGGAVEVETEPGKGTAFHVYLPLNKVEVEKVQEVKTEVMPGCQETILLVDDEIDIREITGEVLRAIGYKVIKASDGQEALQLFKEKQNEIDLVISDVVMPIMGGDKLAKSIWLLDKKVPFIFVTGYDKGQAIFSEDQMDQCIIVNKPFTAVELSRSIRRMIEPD